jgi:hypothetical protein
MKVARHRPIDSRGAAGPAARRPANAVTKFLYPRAAGPGRNTNPSPARGPVPPRAGRNGRRPARCGAPGRPPASLPVRRPARRRRRAAWPARRDAVPPRYRTPPSQTGSPASPPAPRPLPHLDPARGRHHHHPHPPARRRRAAPYRPRRSPQAAAARHRARRRFRSDRRRIPDQPPLSRDIGTAKPGP